MTEKKTRPVRISEEVMEILAKERIGFETPDECLYRLLSNIENSKKTPVVKSKIVKIIDDSAQLQNIVIKP